MTRVAEKLNSGPAAELEMLLRKLDLVVLSLTESEVLFYEPHLHKLNRGNGAEQQLLIRTAYNIASLFMLAWKPRPLWPPPAC